MIRSQAKKSTNSFYSYVSLSIISRNERYTLSVLPVEKGKTKLDYLTYFIDLIHDLSFNFKVLCLDREFYSVDVFEFLQNREVPHIIDEEKFRFNRFTLFVEEWLRRKLKIQLVVECLRQINSKKNKMEEN